MTSQEQSEGGDRGSDPTEPTPEQHTSEGAGLGDDADRLGLIVEVLRSLPPVERAGMLVELSVADRLAVARRLTR